jgi:hypothetical protein
METITHSQVQELIMHLPASKLPFAYSLLVDLTDYEIDIQSPQLNFLRLSISERRRIMAQQAEQMVVHYEQTAGEREAWQGGDFVDEY